jgi:hypothetical protein
MPEVSEDATILLATSWQALNRAKRLRMTAKSIVDELFKVAAKADYKMPTAAGKKLEPMIE